ncbi:MAG: Holliday junction resolvase RuvX [Pseudomonadota bacterium]
MTPAARAAGSRSLLGFDFGLKRIGVAAGNEATATASPVTTVRGGSPAADWDAIAALVAEWRPDLLVVGLPLKPDRTIGTSARNAQRFAEELRTRFALPVELVDETLSSWEAADRLRRERRAGARRRGDARTGLDAVAAQLIVESWLSRQASGAP